MVLAHFKNEWRQNPKGFAHGSKMKTPKMRTEIRTGTGKEEHVRNVMSSHEKTEIDEGLAAKWLT